ncbi:unnamed protein product, partial [Polarella glacialis]
MMYAYKKRDGWRCSFQVAGITGLLVLALFLLAMMASFESEMQHFPPLATEQRRDLLYPPGSMAQQQMNQRLKQQQQLQQHQQQQQQQQDQQQQQQYQNQQQRQRNFRPLPGGDTGNESAGSFSRGWPVDALDNPGVRITRQRDALSTWVSSVATIQEVQTLLDIRSWITKDRAASIANKLNRITSGDGWFECGKEHAMCTCASPQIRYGHDKTWVEWAKPVHIDPKQPFFNVQCDNFNFGGTDPVPYILKTCECYGSSVQAKSMTKASERYCGDTCSKGNSMLYSAAPRERSKLCQRPTTHELLWSCDATSSRVPAKSHEHWEAQDFLDKSVKDMCENRKLTRYLDVYLDCDFAPQYLRHTDSDSEWQEEAFVTYIAGQPNSAHEWMANNLIRSVHLFSKRPIIVVVFDTVFRPPEWWREFPNLLVYRMQIGMPWPVAFNFNKIRAMIGARVIVGIELDLDQIVAPGIDVVFSATRKEVTQHYPFPIMPVHWMSRDAKPGEMFYEYGLHSWRYEHGMRWCHAHPSWTFWALAFYADVLLKRYLLGLTKGTATGRMWALSALKPIDMRALAAAEESSKSLKSYRLQ